VAVEELERRGRHMIGPGAAGDGTVAAAGAPYCRRTAWNAAEAALKRVISTAGLCLRGYRQSTPYRA
jgi:hypothetical protein